MFETITVSTEFDGAARIGILEMDGLRVQESPEELKGMLNGLAEQYAAKYKDAPLGEIPTVRQIRAIFHRAGLDPTPPAEISSPGKYLARMVAAVTPGRSANRADPMTQRPTPWPAP